MAAVKTEAGALTRVQSLPGATAAEGKRSAGTRGPDHVPGIDSDRLAEIDSHRPAADRRGAGVGNAHICLKRSAAITRDRRGTTVRRVCRAQRHQQQRRGHDEF